MRFVTWTQTLLQQAGYDPSQFSTHSYRSGGATDLYAGEAAPRTNQYAGRWHSEAFVIYIRDHPEVIAKDVARAFAAVLACGCDISRT